MLTAAKAVEGQGTPAGSTAGEFAAGWRVLVAAALGVTCGITAVPIYTIGAFVGPLEQAHGWSRSSIQSAVVFAYLTLIVRGPARGAAGRSHRGAPHGDLLRARAVGRGIRLRAARGTLSPACMPATR